MMSTWSAVASLSLHDGVVLDANFAEAETPKNIRLPLKRHQQIGLHAMAELELNAHIHNVYSRFGINAFPTGSGKTLLILALIDKNRGKIGLDEYLVYCAYHHTRQIVRPKFTLFPTLIFVSIPVFAQWVDTIKNHTNLTYLLVEDHRDFFNVCKILYAAANARNPLNDVDIILVKNSKTTTKQIPAYLKHIFESKSGEYYITLFKRVLWDTYTHVRRVVLDDFDVLGVPASSTVIPAHMTWFISATERYHTYPTGTCTKCHENTKYYDAFSQCKQFKISIAPSLVPRQEIRTINEVIEHINPAMIIAVRALISEYSRAYEMFTADAYEMLAKKCSHEHIVHYTGELVPCDIEQVPPRLGCIVKVLLQRYINKQKYANIMIRNCHTAIGHLNVQRCGRLDVANFKKLGMMLYDPKFTFEDLECFLDQPNVLLNEVHVWLINAGINSESARRCIDSFISSIPNVCYLCSAKVEHGHDPSENLLDCCAKVICNQCRIMRASCDQCGDNIITLSNKVAHLISLWPKISGKVLIYSVYPDCLRTLGDYLMAEGIEYIRIGGTSRQVAQQIEHFKAGVNVLLIDGITKCAGIDLPYCDTLVIMHNITTGVGRTNLQHNAIENQIIGRIDRMSRDAPGTVYRIQYKNEN